MHEASLMGNLIAQVERVARENAATKVVNVEIWIGALAHVSPDHVREHFREAAHKGLADGAELTIERSEDIHHVQAQEIVLKAVEVLDLESG